MRGTFAGSLSGWGAAVVVLTLAGPAALEAQEATRPGPRNGAGAETPAAGQEGVEVDVTVRSVLRGFGPEPRELDHVEALLVGPFFEPGRSDVLTMRLVLDAADDDWDSYRNDDPHGEDPWGALERFSGGAVEFYRGMRLLRRVPQEYSWIRMEGLSRSAQTGLVNLHLLQANAGSGPSDLDVLRYDPATDRLERLTFFPAAEVSGEDPWLMTCGEEEWPWDSGTVSGDSVVFNPCLSDVERLEAYRELAGVVRSWGGEVIGRNIRGGVVDLACAACPAVDDETFAAVLSEMQSAAKRVETDSLSVRRFASADFDVAEVEYRGMGDESWFLLMFARPRPDGAWRALYGRDLGYRVDSDDALVEGFVPGTSELVRVSVYPCLERRYSVFVDLETWTAKPAGELAQHRR